LGNIFHHENTEATKALTRFLTKKFIHQQGEGKMAAETYRSTLSAVFLSSTPLMVKFRSILYAVIILLPKY
jgi:hypothetical protein